MNPYESADNHLQKVQNRLIATQTAVSLFCCLRSHGGGGPDGIPLPPGGSMEGIEDLLKRLDDWIEKILTHADKKEKEKQAQQEG